MTGKCQNMELSEFSKKRKMSEFSKTEKRQNLSKSSKVENVTIFLFQLPVFKDSDIFRFWWVFFQGTSSLRRSEGGPRPNLLWTSSALGAGKGLFRPRMRIQPPLDFDVMLVIFWWSFLLVVTLPVVSSYGLYVATTTTLIIP